MIRLRAATPGDADSIWTIVEPVIRAGETYAVDRDMTRDAALAWWLSPAHETHVATNDAGRLLGTYILRENHGGGGAHVANCGYMVATGATGQGIGRIMAEESLSLTCERGFLAMQYNFVVASNTGAIALWHSLGFVEIGRQPQAFRHPRLGLVDALVMHRFL